MHLHRCEFCQTEYRPRAQVKNPKACLNADCQRARQRANEKAWREQHTHLSSKEYHRVRRKQRAHKLQAVVASILKCLEVGARFLNQPVEHGAFLEFLEAFVLELGIRRANKFWPGEIVCDGAMLS